MIQVTEAAWAVEPGWASVQGLGQREPRHLSLGSEAELARLPLHRVWDSPDLLLAGGGIGLAFSCFLSVP